MNNTLPFWVRHAARHSFYPSYSGMRAATLITGYQTPFGVLSAFYASLDHGVLPHPPHEHSEEELIILRSGAIELLIGDSSRVLRAGDYYFVPPDEEHTLRGVSEEPAEFFILKWSLPPDRVPVTHASRTVIACDQVPFCPEGAPGPVYRRQPAIVLRSGVELRPVYVAMRKGHHYSVHRHDYGVINVLLEGPFHAPICDIVAPALQYYSGGVPHGFVRPLAESSLQLAFEIHQPAGALLPPDSVVS